MKLNKALEFLTYTMTDYNEIAQEAIKTLIDELAKHNKKIVKSLPNEEWCDIVGYEGLYQVSNLNRVKSVRNGNEYLLKVQFDLRRYYYVTLSKYGKSKKFSVHRLIAESFIPNPENKEFVNHKDGNPLNNQLDNLEWNTPRENTIHAYKMGLIPVGPEHARAKLTADDVRFIRANYIKGDRTFGCEGLARRFKINAKAIINIVRGKTYKSIK